MANRRNSRYAAKRVQKKRGRGKLIAAILAVCLLAGGYFVLREYLVFTSEGIRFVFDEEEPEVSKAAAPGIPAELPETGPEPRISIDRGELPPADRKELRGAVLNAAGCDPDTLLSEAHALHMDGYTAAVVPVKPWSGDIPTEQELRRAAEVCRAERLRFVAYISCFRDDNAARAEGAPALRDRKGNLFIDSRYCAWLDPAAEASQSLVRDACALAVSCGAQELLLDNLCYPFAGNVENIDYGRYPPDRWTVITTFAETLAGEQKVRLGAFVGGDDTFGEGASESRGQDVTVFAGAFDSLWVDAGSRREAVSLCGRLRELAGDSAAYCAVVDGEYLAAALLND